MLHSLPYTTRTEVPQQFTYPFHYEAHPLCIIAADALQEKLTKWGYNHKNSGKMFGVLIVESEEGELGYLCAYSEHLSETLDAHYFVPPIFDLLDKNNFFIRGEKEISLINKEIKDLKESDLFTSAKGNKERAHAEMTLAVRVQKEKNLSNKKARQEKRLQAKDSLSHDDFKELDAILIKESQREKSALKQLKQYWNIQIKVIEEQFNVLEQEIETLQQHRQEKSNTLQQRLFDQYQLLDANGISKSLCSIFHETINSQPPAAAGDCAAPRLLQHAYIKGLKPIAMAEFWWGQSPKSIVRKHGHYYPACRGKCEPILGHMLQGLDVDDNPLLNTEELSIEIIHEDEEFLIINKPSGMLSVEGRSSQPYVLENLNKLRPDIKNPMMVHRLDMATSGLLLIAKNEASYKALQAQFISRQVKKRYEAILEGNISENGGKIDLPLRGDIDNRPQQMVCHEHGKPALTVWKVLERKNKQTRIVFFPITGRTHQLRVHAAHTDGLNTAIVGDELYGIKSERLLLHAAQLEFTHPSTNSKMKFKSTAPF